MCPCNRPNPVSVTVTAVSASESRSNSVRYNHRYRRKRRSSPLRRAHKRPCSTVKRVGLRLCKTNVRLHHRLLCKRCLNRSPPNKQLHANKPNQRTTNSPMANAANVKARTVISVNHTASEHLGLPANRRLSCVRNRFVCA